jgi:hypothetical protein
MLLKSDRHQLLVLLRKVDNCVFEHVDHSLAAGSLQRKSNSEDTVNVVHFYETVVRTELRPTNQSDPNSDRAEGAHVDVNLKIESTSSRDQTMLTNERT